MRIKKIHYGIFVAIGCFLVMFYAMGMTFNLVSLFLSSMVAERGFSQSHISDAMTLQSIASLLCIFGLGRIYAKYSTRKVLAVCSTAGVLAYLCFTQDSLLMGYLGATFVGIAHGGAALVPVSILLTNWFCKYRGVVLSCCMVGSSFANALCSGVISWMLERWGLASASLVHAGAILALAIVALFLIRDDPHEMGLAPLGADELSDRTAVGRADAVFQADTSGGRNQTGKFIVLASAMFMVGFVITPLNAFYPTFLRSEGYETLFLGTAATAFGVAMIVSKLSAGAIIDGLGIRWATVYLYVLPIAAMISALLVDGDPASAILFAALWGVGNPLSTVPLPIWVMNIFGPAHYKLTYSRILTAFTLGSTCGFFLIGKIADLAHSYHPVFIVNLIFLLASFVMVTLVQQKRNVVSQNEIPSQNN